MIYFNITVKQSGEKVKAQVPLEDIVLVCSSFFDLQMRMYQYFDDFKELTNYRLLFLIEPTKYEQTPIGDTNTNNSGS
jgi:hypothetical protein